MLHKCHTRVAKSFIIFIRVIISALLPTTFLNPGWRTEVCSVITKPSRRYTRIIQVGMPALPSFKNYKPNWKAKAAIKTPFSLRRGENPASPSPPNASHPSNTEIIDIKEDKDDRSSLDFDGGKPNEFESNIVDSDDLPTSRLSDASVSPPAKLEIDLAPEALTDWFAANFPGGESNANASRVKVTDNSIISNGTSNPSANAADFNPVELEGIIEEDFEKNPEVVIARLEKLDVS